MGERLPKSHRVFVLGNVNSEVGTGLQNEVMRAFGVPGVNDNERSLMSV